MTRRASSGIAWALIGVGVAACVPEPPSKTTDAPEEAAEVGHMPSSAHLASAHRGPFGVEQRDGEVVYHGPRGLEARFDPDGMEVGARGSKPTVRLRLATLGRGPHRQDMGRNPARRIAAQHVSYVHAGGVETRYAPKGAGLEQSFVVRQRPPGVDEQPVELRIAVKGALHPAEIAERRAIGLRDRQGTRRFVYRNLAVFDANGQELPASMGVRDGDIRLRFEDEVARYPVVVDPIIVTARTKLVSPDPVEGGKFGFKLALWEDTLVVGNIRDFEPDGRVGAVYVFVRDGTDWSLQQTLSANKGVPGDAFGRQVEIYGDTIIVGASGWNESRGAAYVFVREGEQWRQQTRLTLDDGVSRDGLGVDIALWKDTLLLSAAGRNDGVGAAYLFVRKDRSWVREAVLRPWDEPDVGFGGYVALWRNVAAVGESSDDGAAENAGAVYVFEREGSTWVRDRKLTAESARAGEEFPHNTLALHRNTLAGNTHIASPSNDAESRNRVYVFKRSQGAWSENTTLVDPTDPTSGGSGFGIGAQVSGDRLLITDTRFNGFGHIYRDEQRDWTRILTLETAFGLDNASGVTGAALDGHTAALGTPSADQGAPRAGAAFVYELGTPDGGPSPSDAGLDGGMAQRDGSTRQDAGSDHDAGSADGGHQQEPPPDAGTGPSDADDAGQRAPPGRSVPDAQTRSPDASARADTGPKGVLTTSGCGCRVPARRPETATFTAVALVAFVLRQRRRTTKPTRAH